MTEIEELLPKLRALGSDGTFDGDLKVLLGCKIVFAGMNTIGDLQDLQRLISALHIRHIPVAVKEL